MSGIRAALEAMANKTLVVLARNESLEEYFVDAKHVIFFEPEDKTSFQLALKKALDPEIRKTIIDNAYQLVTEIFTVENMTSELLDVVNNGQ